MWKVQARLEVDQVREANNAPYALRMGSWLVAESWTLSPATHARNETLPA